MKTDLVKEDKDYYNAKTTPEIVEFSNMQYLSIIGIGEPAGEKFTEAVQSLYPLAYGIKGIFKKLSRDFAVPKLEGLWWIDGGRNALDVPRKEWHWKLLIRMPDYVEAESFEKARVEVLKKKGLNLINEIDFETINEGKCIQIMHIGPYSTEPDSISLLNRFMSENGYAQNGLHHEIYISDPRKTVADKMKTIIRYPIKK